VTLSGPNTRQHATASRGATVGVYRPTRLGVGSPSIPATRCTQPHSILLPQTLITQQCLAAAKVERFDGVFLLFAQSLTSPSGSRKGRRQASPQDPPRQHPGHHKARHPSSRSSRWRQAYLWSDLRRDPWCPQNLLGERSCHPLFTCKFLLTCPSRSSVIQLHTPSTQSEKPSPLSTSSMPSSGQDALSTVSVLRCSLASVSICCLVSGVYCTILIRISPISSLVR
jgi:hypothetical protein